jgi:hypothetical protein
MRVCLLSSEYPPEIGWGGIGRYTYNLAHGLEKIGQEVSVISSSFLINQHYLDGKVHVYRIKARRTQLLGLGFFTINVGKMLIGLVKKCNIQVVEAPMTFGESLGFSFAKIRPLVISLHTPSSVFSELLNQPGLFSSRWQRWKIMEKITLTRADRILSSTVANAELVAKHYRIDPSKVRIIPHGINIEKYRFADSGLREKLCLNNRKIVLYVGRLEKRKGVDVLVNSIPSVIKRFSNVCFVFVGADTNTSPTGGSFKEYILASAEINGYRPYVRVVGRVSEKELIEYYFNCDIFVAPSRYESFGLVYVEAMACSKPVIGTDVGGIPEVVKNGKTGLIVPSGDSETLANVLVDLLTDESRRMELGANARREVERSFTDVAMAKKTLSVFEEVT